MTHDSDDIERHEFAGEHYGPTCEECGEVTSETGVCRECVALMRELEADDVWPVWLASLKGGAAEMDALDDKLAGWKYVRATIQYERTAKGKAIASANYVLFSAPGHRGHLIFSRDAETGWPLVTIHGGEDLKYPDWTATFTACTPHGIILAACNAVIHQ